MYFVKSKKIKLDFLSSIYYFNIVGGIGFFLILIMAMSSETWSNPILPTQNESPFYFEDNMKRCSKCKKFKIESEFHKCKTRKDGFHNQCKLCRSIYSKEYYKFHAEKINERNKKYTKNHSEQRKTYRKEYRKSHLEEEVICRKEWRKNNREKDRKYCADWRKKYPEKIKAYEISYRLQRNKNIRNRRKTNCTFRLSCNMRGSMQLALKGNKKGRKWESLVEYTLQDLKKHIEKQFTDGMSWKRFLKGEIHIDHIIPISAHNFKTYNDIDFKRCFALSNLQPMWAKENESKGNKLKKDFQPSFALEI